MRKVIALLLFMVICWTIYIADTSNDHVLLNFSESIPYGDKINHFFLFGMLTFMINISFPKVKLGPIPFGVLFVTIFCVLEEFSQLLFPYRNFNFEDMIFDFLGIGTFTFLSHKWLGRKDVRKNKKKDTGKLSFDQFKTKKTSRK